MTVESGAEAHPTLLGIDIGGTKTAIVAGTRAGEVALRAEFASRAESGPTAMLEDIATQAAAILARFPAISAVGVAVGGPVDGERGLVLGPPNLPGWERIPLADDLSRRLGRLVRIEHDAKAGALAEWRFGAGRGVANLIFLTLGTGLGAGIIADGRLLRGAANAAGEIGHWRATEDGPLAYGKAGSLEGWASGAGLPLLARHLDSDTFMDLSDARDLARRAGRGDPAAQAVIARSGTALGEALAKAADLLAPECIVLGGLGARLGEGFVAPLQRAFEREALPAIVTRCRIVTSGLGERIGDLAALAVAMEAAEAGPSPLPVEEARAVFRSLPDIGAQIGAATTLMVETLRRGSRIFACGNGGSAAEAQHFVTELVGRYKSNRRSLPAVWLGGDTGQMSCIANDFSWDDVFARPLEGLARPGDILLALSTSGRSPNVLSCLRAATRLGLSSVALLGNGGGEAARLATHPVIVPASGTARVQEAHLFLIHAFCDAIEQLDIADV